MPPALAPTSFPVMQRAFPQDGFGIGLILPLETHPGRPAPTMVDHLAMAQRAEQLGFSNLWLRDVPFFDPSYGDVGQIFEPMVYMAYLAAATTTIGLGTAGIVLPLREPKMLAKQAASIDQLSQGRLLLGLSSGDRPSDYPLFDIPYQSRGARFREAFDVLKVVSRQEFPTFDSQHFGRSDGGLNLIPKPKYSRLPTISIGRSQQTELWLAAHMDALIVPAPPEEQLDEATTLWRRHVQSQCGEGISKPIGIAGFLELSEYPKTPFTRIRGGFMAGREGLIEFLHKAKRAGISHAALNPKISKRPYIDVMTELAEYVLPAMAH